MYANPKMFFFHLPSMVYKLNKHDKIHFDLFNNIYQKSNNEKMTSPKHTDLTLFLDDK